MPRLMAREELAFVPHFHDRDSRIGGELADRAANVLMRIVVDDDHLDVGCGIREDRRQ